MAHGKRYKTASETVDRDKTYPLEEAVKIVKANAKAKVKEIAEQKMKDLNCDTIESAMRMIEGSARSMGLEVRE